MQDLLHAIGFIITFGVFFVGIIIAEAYYWHRKGRTDIYDYRESVSSIITGAMYKISDGILIAVVITDRKSVV